MSDQMEMPKYQSHKKVWALKIKQVCVSWGFEGPFEGHLVPEDSRYGNIPISEEYYKINPKLAAGGYYVVYEGGYTSYSPAEAFEAGYTLVKPLYTVTP